MIDTGLGLNKQAQPHTNEIIADFSHKSKMVYLILGLEHLEIMQKLPVNFVIFDSFKTLEDITPYDSITLKEQLKAFIPFFIGTSQDDYIGALKRYKINFEKIVKQMYIIDLEILKAIEIIGLEELQKNDHIIGLELPNDYTLHNYINEVINEARHKPMDLYTYLKNLLSIETQRLIDAK